MRSHRGPRRLVVAARLPGRPITDHQMRLYMKDRQTDTLLAAAAKASFSTSTAYRTEKDPAFHRGRSEPATAAGRTPWPQRLRPPCLRQRSCRC